MHVPEIIEVKDVLDRLVADGVVDTWELPYETLITRRSAATFFVRPKQDAGKIWDELSRFGDFSFRINTEKKLSALDYRVTFSREEKEKNATLGNA